MADTQQNTEPKKPKQPKAAKDAGDAAPKVKKPRERSDYVARLKTHFEQVIRGELSKQFGYTNRMQVPVITKVVLNMGIGEGVADRKKVDSAAADLTLIAGQKAVITKSRKSIATYKLRDGQAIGCKVTLRKTRMYDFIDRLVNIALPRIRDFRGLNPKSFDGRGNYSLGIKEHIVFPEIDFDKVTDYLGHGHHRLHQRAHRRRGARAAGGIQLPVPAVRGDFRSLKRGNKELKVMAKKSSIEKNNRRRRMAKQFANRRKALKAIARDKKLPMEERFAATLKLAELPRNSSATRIRNRCELSGRPRAYYRKHRLSRIALRDLGSKGLIPGLVKSSW